MKQKGYISEFINGGRIVSHGKVENLDNGFSLPNNMPFSVYIRPKAETAKIDVVMNVRCWQEQVFSDAPFVLNDWSPLAVSAIGADSSILEHYDVYWGCGSAVEV
jgi:hypothetical protein